MTDQAETQSGADNTSAPAEMSTSDLAALFGAGSNVSTESDEQPQGQAEADDVESEDNPEQAAVEAAVEKFKVPALEGDGFDELTADELKAQRLMQKDYTQKTQALAEQRKAQEAETQKVMATLTAKSDEIEQGLVMLGKAIQSFDENVNWEALKAVDPASYLEAREKQAERVKAFKQAAGQLEAMRKAQAAQLQAVNAQRLVEAIPTWLDKATAQKEAAEIRGVLTEAYGYADEDIDGISDYRVILLARDALKFRQAQKAAAEVKPKVEAAPKLAKTGTVRQGNPEALARHRVAQKAINQPSRENLAALFASTR